MINARNISGLLIIICMSIYFLFGDPDSFFWCGFYFSLWNFISVYLCSLALKSYRDLLLRIVLKIIMGISLAKLFFSIYSFFDIDIYNKINRSYESGGFLVGCILIFLIYTKYERFFKK